MEPNKIENEFRDKLEQRRIQPSEMAWDRLDAMLSVTENKKPKKKRTWMYVAAAFLVFLLAGVLFLNQEKQGNGVENNNSVVTTKEQPQPATETVQLQNVVPVIIQEAVAAKEQVRGTVKKKSVQPVSKMHEVPAMNTEAVAANDKKEIQNVVPQATADNLLASTMTNETPKKRSTVKVDPNALLSNVEGELNENYRSKAFQGVVKSFNTVKVAVSNRNYE